ncbi:MAG: polyhydroxyalkanoic acid system family protein [Sandaracinaceae bacterium]|nr:polyhydroxyalkanoic acid system family protein [Sandaracinaceae bacterium]
MKHTIQTNLDLARSKLAIDKAMEAYKARFAEYNPRFDWTTDTRGEFGFKAKGVSLGGTILVHDHKVDVDMEVPFLFRIFQGKAMEVIEDEVRHWVEKVKKGEI